MQTDCLVADAVVLIRPSLVARYHGEVSYLILCWPWIVYR